MIVFFTWILFFLECIICRLFIPEIYYLENFNEISLILILFNIPFVVSANFIIQHSFEEAFACSFGFLFITLIVCFDRLYMPLDTTDPDGFHLAAMGIINYSTPYTKCISIFYDLFGQLRMAAQYLNALLFFSTSYLLKKIFDILQINKKSRIISFSLLIFSPFFIESSGVLRRETFIVFFITTSLFYFIEWLQKNKKIFLLLACIFSLAASAFHTGCMSVFLAYTIAGVLYNYSSKSFEIHWLTSIYVLFFLFFFFYIYTYWGELFFAKIQAFDFQKKSEALQNLRGGSGYTVPSVQLANPFLDFLINTPLRTIYYLFSPMPWNWRGFSDVFAFLFSSVYYGIGLMLSIKYLIRGAFSKDDRTIIIICLLIFILAAVIFSWGVQNAGTAIRHRNKFICVYLVIVAICTNRRLNKN